MSDLVARLRAVGVVVSLIPGWDPDGPNVLVDAAGELERLRAANDELLAALRSVLDDLDAYAAIGGARTAAHVEASAIIAQHESSTS